MSTVLIFDTECTDRDDPELIEAAWIRIPFADDLAGLSDRIVRPLVASPDVSTFVRRYKPEKPISYGAMAVHHILPEDVEGLGPSSEFALPDDVEYLIGHNIDFDWRVIGSPSVKRICTDAMARWIWQDADSYSQSALLYRLLGPTPLTRNRLKGAHSAWADVENNALLLEQILDAKPEITTWAALHEYSEQCRIPRVMPIGEKQGVKGMTLDEAVEADLSFVYWCLRQDWLDPYLAKGLHQAIDRMNAKWTGESA